MSAMSRSESIGTMKRQADRGATSGSTLNSTRVAKGKGETASERYLAKLAEQSFLNLWCYPNPYRDQGRTRGRDGKELCDLLVVCGRHIVIFSEKNIGWPKGDVGLAWRRWAKRALIASARQARGAERWIREYPNRIFLDRKCVHQFPIDIPRAENATIHCVIVARGAGRACAAHFGDNIGSLRLRSDVMGNEHFSADALPFTVGDVDPGGSFIHVMDDVTLDFVLGELDTVLDFTDYLTKKAAFVRSGILRTALGEQDLLAHYAIRMNEHGEHDFQSGKQPFEVRPGECQRFMQDPRYLARKEADRPSYIWDRLIEKFTSHMIDGTIQVLDGYQYDLRRNEVGARYMALERRVPRRTLGAGIADALQRGAQVPIFFRRMIAPGTETGYFVLTMKYTSETRGFGGYTEYRRMRANAAEICARGVLVRHPQLARVVGISCEPMGQIESSEDLILMDQADWSDADRDAIFKDCRRLGVLQPGSTVRHRREEEFPIP